MKKQANFYAPLAKRADFNVAVRHIQGVLELLEDVSTTSNLADQINDLINSRSFDPNQTPAVVSIILQDKWAYKVRSKNLLCVPKTPNMLVQEIQKWKGVDIVFGYHHPDLGFIVVNPKNPLSVPIIESFRKNELLLIFTGLQNTGELEDKVADGVLDAIEKLLEGKKATPPTGVLKGRFTFVEKKAPAPKKRKLTPRKKQKVAVKQTVSQKVQAVPTTPVDDIYERPAPTGAPAGSRMSNLISVVVSNELFHNGNVEAWKRIIRSYNARYPNTEVIVFYEGERIVDINTLFKWGKVKHGSCIQFAVAGEEFKDLAKLSKYFREGASPRFEAFLHGSPDTVLNLF